MLCGIMLKAIENDVRKKFLTSLFALQYRMNSSVCGRTQKSIPKNLDQYAKPRRSPSFLPYLPYLFVCIYLCVHEVVCLAKPGPRSQALTKLFGFSPNPCLTQKIPESERRVPDFGIEM